MITGKTHELQNNFPSNRKVQVKVGPEDIFTFIETDQQQNHEMMFIPRNQAFRIGGSICTWAT